jgi:hypothetical protein
MFSLGDKQRAIDTLEIPRVESLAMGVSGRIDRLQGPHHPRQCSSLEA